MRRLLTFVAIALAVLALDSRVLRARQLFGFDFYQCWVMGRTLRSGEAVGNIYADAERDRIGLRYWRVAYTSPLATDRQREAAEHRVRIDTTGTPFFYLAFAPFACERYESAYDGYVAIDLALLVIAVVALGVKWRFSTAAIAVAVALTCCAYPVRHDLAVLNVSSLQAGLCVLYLLLRHRAAGPVRLAASGLFLGLLVAFKPNLAFVPVLLGAHQLLRRAWRPLLVEMGAAAAGLALAVLVSSLRFGTFDCWLNWLQTLHTFYRRPDMAVNAGSLSIARLIFDYTGRDVSTLLSAALVAVVLGAMVWRGRRRPAPANVEADDEFTTSALLLGLGVVVATLGGPLAWHHYIVMALPLVIYCCRPVQAERRWQAKSLVRYTLAGLAVAPFFLNLTRGWPQRRAMLFHGVMAEVSLLLLFAMGVWYVARGTPISSGPERAR